MPDNINTAMINSVKETIKSSTIWNKLVKTIENANINMDKLIQDSVEYGIEIGMFHQNKDGKIECKETKRISNVQITDKFISPLQQKNVRNDEMSQINTRSAPKSDSETTLSAYSSSKSIVTRTRKSNAEKELKRSSDNFSETDVKRLKSDLSINSGSGDNPKNKQNDQMPTKVYKTKPINKKMVRPIPICAFCLGDEALNKRTKKPENMITCWDCGTCAHPTCLQWPDSLFQKVRTIRWQCLQCKRCSYCGMISKKDDDMLLCDVCDQGFHTYCCDPPIKVPPKGEWVCRFCRPIPGRKEKPSIFLLEDYEFEPDCQIMTPESVKKLCNLPPKVFNSSSAKSHKNKTKIKSKLSRKTNKVNLLQLKKKKLVSKAVQRQRQALTDGLSKFFTPSNKRQSRVSKQSISSDSLFDKDSKKSPSIASPKDKSSNRSIVSSSRSKSPITVDVIDESDTSKSQNEKRRTPNKKVPEISIYHSPKRSNLEMKSQSNGKTKLKKSKLNKIIEMSPNKIDNDLSLNRGPGRPKKQLSNGKHTSAIDNSPSINESSSITMSKNDLSTNYSVLSADNCETDPYPISDIDRLWYTDIQQKVVELLPPPVDAAPELQPLNKLMTTCRGRNEHSEPPELSIEIGHGVDSYHSSHSNSDGSITQRFPPRIQIGRYIIDTWYSAPYPSEYARLNVLYICEYCLKPIKSYDVYVMHMEKCTSFFPPGNEIYRSGNLSVFEVDGYVSKLYCQQLCLLAKLFLDHKTLYYDVEPFLFYVAVLSKDNSSHIIGYFSKEKRSTHKYNLSCIMVLPPYQKFNYGRFLIDFSYLLSRKEGQCGSPEKPLSTLGRISYESYWKSKILPFILNKDDVTVDFYARQKIYKPSKGLAVTIDRVSTETGISPHDVASTIQLLSKKVDLDNSDRISIQFNWEKLKSEAEKYASRYPKWIPIDEECLRWVPLINPNERLSNPLKSSSSGLNSPKDNLLISGMDKTISRKITNENNKGHSVVDFHSSVKETEDLTTSNSGKPVITKPSKKKREPVKTNKSSKTPQKLKAAIKPKSLASDKKDTKIISNKKMRKTEISENRDQIVTRNRSNKHTNSNSSNSEEISPIKVDLTKESSENSDVQDNDDCIEISSSIPQTRKSDIWNYKKPVFEIFKNAATPQTNVLTLLPPKESPPINRNDPSPVSTVNNEIVGPVLISPEIDEENEEENDIGPIINDKRRLILILEKWDAVKVNCVDSPKPDTIDLSNDVVVDEEKNEESVETKDRNVFVAMEGQGDRSIEVVISEDSLQQSHSPSIFNQTALSNSEDSLASSNSECISEPSKTKEFILPANVKDSVITDDCDKPPTLSRISSQEDSTSNHMDDSSTSFNLPADISQNEEFKNFYNDGNVFNSITTSQTDSSEKDADESLLSVSNSNSYGISDLELNGAYSCDSSICYNLRPRVRSSRLEEDFFENPLRCSPGQSDLVQNHVSSTTPFVSPSITEDLKANTEANSLKREMSFEEVGLINDETPVATSQRRYLDSNKEMSDPNTEGEINKSEENKEVDPIKDIEMKVAEQPQVDVDIVSSSLNETSIISDSSL